jgi:1-deoxy-D-xylulose-5-phosphate synthase
MFLENIRSPEDIKKLNINELNILAKEMRTALINKASKVGGHLGSNLGVVELTIALHYVFDCPDDKIVWDVSHQTYCHKMLTGRVRAFLNEAEYNTVTGYTNPEESKYDLFSIGHTSTAIGLATGIAKERDLKNGKENVIAVVGDAALDGGQSFESLNFAGELGTGIIIVVNDNDMSIPENHGALRNNLNRLHYSSRNCKDNYFKVLGFSYKIIRDGHDLSKLVRTFKEVKNTKKPVVVHVCTVKGKGYKYAEEDKEKWHWAKPFDIKSGIYQSTIPKENYGSIIRDYLLEKITNDKDVVVIAASTPHCIGFNSNARKKAGKQFIDVGIAEQNAVTIATGIAKRGGKPIIATFASFWQRAYDQIEQEMCLNKIPVTMIITNASVYGQNDETHCGLYDIPLLGNIRNLMYLAPTNKEEYINMLEWSINQNKTPVAIRVPWTEVNHSDEDVEKDYSKEKYKITINGNKLAILALGSFYQLGQRIEKFVEEKTKIKPTLINPRYINDVDSETLELLKKNHKYIITLEDGLLSGGWGSRIAQFYSDSDIKVKC